MAQVRAGARVNHLRARHEGDGAVGDLAQGFARKPSRKAPQETPCC
jgi:hypothetical protein